MTQEQLNNLITQVQSDAALQEKLAAAAAPDGQLTIDDVMSIAKEANVVIPDDALVQRQDLTEEQLSAVMGGRSVVAKQIAQSMAYGFVSAVSLGIWPALDASTGWSEFNGIVNER